MLTTRTATARTATAALLLGAVLALTGCSADASARGELSQTAKDAASSAGSAASSIRLHENAQLTEAVLGTGLEDVGSQLADSAKNLTTLAAVGGIAARRDRILREVRSAQDVLLDAQSQLSVGKGDDHSLEPQRRKLAALSVTLQKEYQQLDAHG